MIKGLAGKESFDFIFIDPPYKDKIIPNVLKALLNAGVIANGAKIICESSDEDVFGGDQELAEVFSVFKQSKYSISYVTVLTLKNDEE